MRINIFKYPVNPGYNSIEMVQKSELLSVGLDPQGRICIWAKHELKLESGLSEEREILILGTGNPSDLPEEFKFLGTVQDGPFMWHAFGK